MTGSLLFNRQHSSTGGSSAVNKKARPKLRRYSSVDDRNSIEVTPDDKQFIKREPTSSDVDSGVEDLDQQVINYVPSQKNDDDEEQSPILFRACDDESLTEEVLPYHIEECVDPEQQHIQRIRNDLALAAKIVNYEKKDFCADTREVFHGEFTRRILFPITLNYQDTHYCLFAEDEVNGDPCQWEGFGFIKLDNAKAQFKCPNICCQRSWTSMRARISFKISQPQPNGYIVLKIFGQKCQHCATPADALWYMEEVCRVMGNLTQTIFETYFPALIDSGYLQDDQAMEKFDKAPRRPRHDPYQRKGKMHAPHDRNFCEACQHGWCFI